MKPSAKKWTAEELDQMEEDVMKILDGDVQVISRVLGVAPEELGKRFPEIPRHC